MCFAFMFWNKKKQTPSFEKKKKNETWEHDNNSKLIAVRRLQSVRLLFLRTYYVVHASYFV